MENLTTPLCRLQPTVVNLMEAHTPKALNSGLIFFGSAGIFLFLSRRHSENSIAVVSDHMPQRHGT